MLLGLETSSMAVFIGSDHFLKYFNYPGSFLQGVIAGSNPAGALSNLKPIINIIKILQINVLTV